MPDFFLLLEIWENMIELRSTDLQKAPLLKLSGFIFYQQLRPGQGVV